MLCGSNVMSPSMGSTSENSSADEIEAQFIEVMELPEESPGSTPPDSSEEDEELRRNEVSKGVEDSAEYWQILKLMKYIKDGNQTATAVSLGYLKDYNLSSKMNQKAIRETGGLELLVNILETRDLACKKGSLEVLSELSEYVDVCRHITNLGIVYILVELLLHPARDIQILAAKTMGNVSKLHRARRIVRKCDGIPLLVNLLDIKNNILMTSLDELPPGDIEEVHAAKAGVRALWSVAQSKKSRKVMQDTGCIYLLTRLLQSVHGEIVLLAMGTLQQCASEDYFQLAIQSEGMIPDLVQRLSSDNMELKKHCSSAIFKCAHNPITRDIIRQCGGLDPLVMLAKDETIRKDKSFLAAVTGAIWQCAISPENVHRFNQLNLVDTLVSLLDYDEDEEIVLYVVGALAECAKFSENRTKIRISGGIPKLIMLLNGTEEQMIVNVCRVLGECANEIESMEIIDELDGVQLIWFQLKHTSPMVQANAAWALCPCIQNVKDSGEMVRSLSEGVVLVVKRLNTTDIDVLASTCALLAKIAEDRENVATITYYGVVPMLANLINTKEEILQEHLAEAIAACCSWSDNCQEFGHLGVVIPLVKYMSSKNQDIHRTAAKALYKLSADPYNCIVMHHNKLVPILLRSIHSSDKSLQEASAGCLSNIRKLALKADRFKHSN